MPLRIFTNISKSSYFSGENIKFFPANLTKKSKIMTIRENKIEQCYISRKITSRILQE